ncbi:MAG: DUF4870 family protein [Afipia sp.]
MTNAVEPSASQPALSAKSLVLTVYILYAIGFFTGLTALIGVIIAHVKASTADEVSRSHFRFQIRTFWVGLLLLLTGSFLLYFVVGIPILLLWLVWTIVRIIKGLVVLNDGRPIANPTSWLFG